MNAADFVSLLGAKGKPRKTLSGWQCCCSAHDDKNPSLSVADGDNGGVIVKCFAGCKTEAICAAIGLTVRDLMPPRPASIAPQAKPRRDATGESFDWQKCVADFTEADAQKLAAWRGLSIEFVRWLHAQGVVGIFDGKTAFANHGDGGKVVSAHVRLTNGKWIFKPTGQKTAPLVFGDTKAAGYVLAFESQFDAFAVMDKLGWHTGNGLADTAIFITRGAANGKLICGQIAPDATCYAFKQNDAPTPKKPVPPGDEWLAEIASNAGCTVLNVATPTPHADPNDWTRAGATATDLQAAMKAAKPVKPKAAPVETSASVASSTALAIAALDDPDLTEFEYANALESALPSIKCVGSNWFAYKGGAWQKTSRDIFRPVAQNILPHIIRTARREATLLDHLEGRCQVAEDAFRGFYRFADNGEILINAANGIVCVTADKTPELLPHTDKHLFTHRTAAMFDPQASADLFKKILVESLPDELDRELLQLCLGNFLLPDSRFEVALDCYGKGGRGKGTIAEPILAALGENLVCALSLKQICDPSGYYLPKLQLAAVNLGTELDAVAIEESENFKRAVSGEYVEARPIYGKPLTMKTNCKLWFLSNGLPRFKNGTDAELRRMRFIRFDREPEKKDVTLKNRLRAERDGVFNFMIEGLQRLLTLKEIPFGGTESQSVHARFKISNDPLGTFIEQECILDAEASEPVAMLQNAFNRFCETQGLPVTFGDWFIKRLYESFTNLKPTRPSIGGERVRCVAGIKLKSTLEID